MDERKRIVRDGGNPHKAQYISVCKCSHKTNYYIQ